MGYLQKRGPSALCDDFLAKIARHYDFMTFSLASAADFALIGGWLQPQSACSASEALILADEARPLGF
jgi:hypothetical protein